MNSRAIPKSPWSISSPPSSHGYGSGSRPSPWTLLTCRGTLTSAENYVNVLLLPWQNYFIREAGESEGVRCHVVGESCCLLGFTFSLETGSGSEIHIFIKQCSERGDQSQLGSSGLLRNVIQESFQHLILTRITLAFKYLQLDLL